MEKVGEELREKILIVRDVPFYHTATPELLRRSGYAYSIVEQSLQTLERISLQSPDLIVLDLGMPGPDGLQLCAQIKSDPFTRHIPIMVLGTPNPTVNQNHWYNSGADHWFEYPCPPELLIAYIQSFLKRSVEYEPVTHLPTGATLHRQLDGWLAKNIPTAIMYVDIDRFSSYKSAYGEEAGNRVLQKLARLIVDALPNGDVLTAYLCEDDFMLAFSPQGTGTVAQTLVDRFRAARVEFYNESDFAQGYIQEMDPFQPVRTWPLMTLSVALVTNERQLLINYMKVSSSLSRLMLRVKARGGDQWGIDQPL